MHVSAEPVFPPEILEELIDRLHSTTALLSFGLVCRRALIKTRHILFSNLEFTKNEDFEQFLKLVDAPWTSFTLAIKEIHLTDLFHPHDHEYRDQIDSTRIASNLCNVKSLSIFAHRLWISGWKVIPRSVLDVIFQLKIHDLHLDTLDVLDPSVNPDLDVTVHTFHIRDPGLPTFGAFNPLTWRFLQHVGHSIEQLLITFQEPLLPSLLVKNFNLR
ncbi:hypothetical protein F5887DRAFT_914776 [Amanita rubescens]|nr:hypothetical protein F5887DRAFT_914776 [Amanita rubescens]